MTDTTAELLSQITAQLAALRGQTPTPATTPWSAAPMPPTGLIQGVAVPIYVATPLGEIRCYVSLPAEVAQSPQALLNAIQALASLGLPLATRHDSGKPWNGTAGDQGDWNGSRWNQNEQSSRPYRQSWQQGGHRYGGGYRNYGGNGWNGRG